MTPAIAGVPPQAPGPMAALLFALVAHRLSTFYEHDQWLTEAQGAQLCADWLHRGQRTLPSATRRQLSSLSDAMAREMAASLSRAAGLYASHEMMESLDANYQSDFARTLMEECAQRVAAALPD